MAGLFFYLFMQSAQNNRIFLVILPIAFCGTSGYNILVKQNKSNKGKENENINDIMDRPQARRERK